MSPFSLNLGGLHICLGEQSMVETMLHGIRCWMRNGVDFYPCFPSLWTPELPFICLLRVMLLYCRDQMKGPHRDNETNLLALQF